MYCEGSESEQAEVLVGCMLGDGTLEMRGLNARLRFIQALTQEGSVYAMLSSPRAVMVAQNYPLFRFAFLGPARVFCKLAFFVPLACFVPYYIRFIPNIIRYKTRNRRFIPYMRFVYNF